MLQKLQCWWGNHKEQVYAEKFLGDNPDNERWLKVFVCVKCGEARIEMREDQYGDFVGIARPPMNLIEQEKIRALVLNGQWPKKVRDE